MTWEFVTHVNDQMADSISNLFPEISILEWDETARPGQVAVFSYTKLPGEDDVFKGRGGHYLFTASHAVPYTIVPDWALETSYKIVVLTMIDRDSRNSTVKVKRAFKTIYDAYRDWEPGTNGHEVPWGNPPKGENNLGKYLSWREKAWVERGTSVTPGRIIETHGLRALYGNPRKWLNGVRGFYLMSCMNLNSTRTDVVPLSKRKAAMVVEYLSKLLIELRRLSAVDSLTMAVADESMLNDPDLRGSINPFIYMDVAHIRSVIKLPEPVVGFRRSGNYSELSEQELRETLNFNARAMKDSIVNQLDKLTPSSLPVATIGWYEMLNQGGILEQAKRLAKTFDWLAIQIYEKRCASYFSYKRINDALGYQAGLARTRANLVIYLATALWSHYNRDYVMIDAEYDDQWMTELKPALEAIWENDPPLYLTLHPQYRQPWI